MNLTPPDHEHVLVFFVGLFVLLVTARALGRLSQRLGQPSVIGELAAGLVLGPSLLGKVWPEAFDWLFPDDDVQTAMLFTVGWLGVAFLLLGAGYETDLGLIRRLGRAAGIVATTSLVVPIAAGLVVGHSLPDLFLGESADRTVFALFVAVALSISSLPVIAKILGEMGLMRRNFGQVNLAAGMANDVVGWILLGLIAGMAQEGEIDPGKLALTVLGLTLFFLAAFTVGQRGIDRMLRNLRSREEPVTAGIAGVLLVAIGFGVVTEWLGVEAILGAFVAGMVLGRSRFRRDEPLEHVDAFNAAFLAPVFFATAGLRVDLGLLGQSDVLLWALVVLVVASVSKLVGGILGGWLSGLPGREGLALGVGLNARGALEIVIATVGLTLGVLNQASYTVIVLMAMATSMMAPPLLRAVLTGWQGTDEEQERLQREEALGRNVLVKAERALLPTRGGSGSIVAAQVLQYAWPQQSPVTVLALEDEDIPEVDAAPLVNVFHDRDVEIHRVPYDEAYEQVPHHARLGYGIVAMALPDGADHPGHEGPLTPLAAQLIGTIELPLVLVRKARGIDGKLPSAFSRALVPVAGGRSARAAQELAFGMATQLGTEMVLAHVVARRPEGVLAGVRSRGRRRESRTAQPDRLMEQAVSHAGELGVEPQTVIRQSTSTASELVRAARDVEADLVVLGASARTVEHNTFLGHTVEQVLDECDATVVVVVSPPEV
jgi:Kef-type K+ transport system membrane component KefB/nucleotide-binding universal stress UspA family protein